MNERIYNSATFLNFKYGSYYSRFISKTTFFRPNYRQPIYQTAQNNSYFNNTNKYIEDNQNVIESTATCHSTQELDAPENPIEQLDTPKNPTLSENILDNKETNSSDINHKQPIEDASEDYKTNKDKDEPIYRFGPLNINQNSISAFGISMALDDLIIIGLAIFLLIEKSNDYIVIIILALILFDIKLSSLGELNFLKNLQLFN